MDEANLTRSQRSGGTYGRASYRLKLLVQLEASLGALAPTYLEAQVWSFRCWGLGPRRISCRAWLQTAVQEDAQLSCTCMPCSKSYQLGTCMYAVVPVRLVGWVLAVGFKYSAGSSHVNCAAAGVGLLFAW